MSELACSINREAFEVPASAAGWRVHRMRTKGAPEVVYGRDAASRRAADGRFGSG